MCWMCDHPGTRAGYLDYMRSLISRCGWVIQGVERDGPHPPWAYTVGLTRLGRPELVVTGMSPQPAARLLNDVTAEALHTGDPGLGDRIELTGGPVIQIIEVAVPTAHLRIAAEMFGPRLRALQVVHADGRGHWPWESGYRGVLGGQPVLGLAGPRATQPAPRIALAPPPGGPASSGRRPAGRSDTATKRPSRESGRRRASREPRLRSARSSSRPPSPRR